MLSGQATPRLDGSTGQVATQQAERDVSEMWLYRLLIPQAVQHTGNRPAWVMYDRLNIGFAHGQW